MKRILDVMKVISLIVNIVVFTTDCYSISCM